jgi:hypothetical protein
VRHDTEAHPRTWAFVNPELWVYHWDEDVPPDRRGQARTVCLIHIANYASELRGCCAIGLDRGMNGPRRMVQRSSAGRGATAPCSSCKKSSLGPTTTSIRVTYAPDRR